MNQVIEDRKDGNVTYHTVVTMHDEKEALLEIMKNVTIASEKHQTIIKLGEDSSKNLFEVLLEKFGKWNDMKQLPNEEELVAVKKDGKVYTEIVYRKGEDWFLANGKKLTKTFAKQFHNWKYSSML